MQKEIYLDVVMRLERIDPSKMPAPKQPQTDPILDEVQRLIAPALQRGTPNAKLTGSIKRLLHGDEGQPPRSLNLLIYLRGEQDASHNFTTLATTELQKLLDQLLLKPTSPALSLKVASISENTSAVDELADEARS